MGILSTARKGAQRQTPIRLWLEPLFRPKFKPTLFPSTLLALLQNEETTYCSLVLEGRGSRVGRRLLCDNHLAEVKGCPSLRVGPLERILPLSNGDHLSSRLSSIETPATRVGGRGKGSITALINPKLPGPSPHNKEERERARKGVERQCGRPRNHGHSYESMRTHLS